MGSKSHQRFLPEYTEKYPEIVKSSKSVEHAFCTTCSKHFKVSHGGISDIKTHCQGLSHKNIAKANTSQMDIRKIGFTTSQDKSVIRAECQMALFKCFF